MRIHSFIITHTPVIPHQGKATLFVANQNTLDALPEHTIKALSDETDALLEGTKALTAEIKTASAGGATITPPPHASCPIITVPPRADEDTARADRR
jgi:hypothetical protein